MAHGFSYASAMSNQRVAHRASQAFTAKHAVSELPASMQADLASARPVASSLCFPQQLSQNSWCPKPWTDGWLISNLIQKISDYMNMCLCFFLDDFYDDVDLLMPFSLPRVFL